MGIATSALVAVGALAVQFTTFGMTLTMAMGRYKKRDWWGHLPTYLAILAYHVMVRTGGNVKDPLDLYILGDYFDAKRILYIVYPVLLYFYCQIGFWFQKVLSNVQVLRLTELIPYPLRPWIIPQAVQKPDGGYTVRSLAYDRNSPERNFGVLGLEPSWFQQIVSLIWILGGIGAPQVVYDLYSVKTGWAWQAYVILMTVTAGTTLLMDLFCTFVYTDPGTFGLTRKYIEAHSDEFKMTEEEIASIDRATKIRVQWAILPAGVSGLFGSFIMGGWYLINPDVDRQWLGAVGLWAFYAVILFIICIVMRPEENPFVRTKGPKQIDDSQGYVEQMAQPATGVTGVATTTTTVVTPTNQRIVYSSLASQKMNKGIQPMHVSMHDEAMW